MKFVFFLVFVFSFFFTFGQNSLDNLMVKKVISNEDIATNCSQLIEKYLKEKKTDSVEIILNYWEENNGINEPIIRMRILLSILKNSFSERIYDSTIIEEINNFKLRINAKQEIDFYNYNKIYFDFIPLNKDFDRFTKNLASELLLLQNENNIAYLFCKLYSGDIDYFYNQLQTNTQFFDSKLYLYYKKELNKFNKLIDINFSIYTGIWLPQNNLSILGNHPLIGFDCGFKSNKMTYNLSIHFKFLSSDSYYLTTYNNSLEKTNHYFGGYIGLDFEREIYKNLTNEFDVLGGIAFDGFDAIEVENNNNNNSGKSINSLNLNLGIGYKFYIKHSYLGIRTKYNYLNYKNDGGTDLKGNALSIMLVYGFLGNKYKQENLNSLGIKN